MIYNRKCPPCTYSPSSKMRFLSLFTILLLSTPSAAQTFSFRQDIAPLLETKCLRCHSGANPKGDLDLSTEKGLQQGSSSGQVIDSKQPKESLLLQMVQARKMPPKEKLTDKEIESLRKWIESGAKWQGSNLKAPSQEKTQAANRAGPDWWSL